jgi:hypothetical protein
MPKTVKIEWNKPADIVSGTKLDKLQLCATACDDTGVEVPGEFEYDPRPGTELPPGEHKLCVIFHPKDGRAYEKAEHSTSLTVMPPSAAAASSGYKTAGGTATGTTGGPSGASTVKVKGTVKYGRDGTQPPIEAVCVTLNDIDCDKSSDQKTGTDGSYAFDATAGSDVSIEFPSIAIFNGRKVALLDPQRTYLHPCTDVELPVTRYISRGCEISGRAVRADCSPLAGATVTLHQAGANGDTTIGQATTGSDGRFSIVTEQTGRLKVSFESLETDGGQLLPSIGDLDLFVDGQCPDICLPQVTYSAMAAQLSGIVTDATNRPLAGIPVELQNADGTPLGSAVTNNNGLWTFPGLQPGDYQVRFQQVIPSKSLELVGQGQVQPFELKAGDSKFAATVTYQPEPHIIEQLVLIGDQPAEGILVDVRKPGAPSALQAARTVNGLVSFVLDEEGTYEVHVYQDQQKPGDPIIQYYEVHSTVRNTARIAAPLPSGAPGSGGQVPGLGGPVIGPGSTGGPVSRAITDLASYPVLTEEIGYPPSPLARSAGMPSSGGATSGLGQIATKAISDVLGWQVKSDPKAFLGALNASFALKEVGGHTEATWTPRTYAVQTDLSGGITGAQASVYTRAKSALDQSLPLLDGLYSLLEDAKPEEIGALRATVRSQFTDLVNEFGLLGGPRIARINQLFLLLLGQSLPQTAPPSGTFTLITDPDQLAGSLGNLRQELGLSTEADQVNTIEDEQNVTNYRIVCDHLTSLAQSWINNLAFFGLQTKTPFFGTQLVLLSRQLSVIAEKTNEVRFTLDSVFIGPADRQTLQVHFAKDPDMFLEDLLTWVDGFASEEGPRLIAEGGKFAVGQSFLPIAEQLQRLVVGVTAQQSNTPPGFRTTRVQNALKDLADALQQLVNLAAPISHVITPTPQSPLAVLGIAPNTIPVNKQSVLLTIIGTGFDVGGGTSQTSVSNPTVTITLDSNNPITSTPAIASSNLLYVALNTSTIVKKQGSHQISVEVTNRNGQSATLLTDLFVL